MQSMYNNIIVLNCIHAVPIYNMLTKWAPYSNCTLEKRMHVVFTSFELTSVCIVKTNQLYKMWLRKLQKQIM